MWNNFCAEGFLNKNEPQPINGKKLVFRGLWPQKSDLEGEDWGGFSVCDKVDPLLQNKPQKPSIVICWGSDFFYCTT